MNKGKYRITDSRREYFADTATEAVEFMRKCDFSEVSIDSWRWCNVWNKEKYVTAHIPTVHVMARRELNNDQH